MQLLRSFFHPTHQPGKIYFWNSLSGFINAGQAVVLSMVVTRTNGLEDAGILSIAFAIGNLLMTIGRYGVRTYQVSDVDKRGSFPAYFTQRIMTVAVMLLCSVTYIAYGMLKSGYSGMKAAVILCVCTIYAIESVEDVFCGLYQKQDALDVGGKVYSLRWGVTLAAAVICLVCFKNLMISMAVATAVTAVCAAVFLYESFGFFRAKLCFAHSSYIRTIFRDCFPLFLIGFMTYYITNAPKYAIDRYYPEDIQAVYGFISMPVFAIELLSNFIYQPTLTGITQEWSARETGKIKRRVMRQIGYILLIMALCMAAGYTVGIPVLSALFHADLASFRGPFVILLMGGGFLACVMYLNVVLTVIRRQRVTMSCFGLFTILTVVISGTVARRFALVGCAIQYTAEMAALAVILYVLFWLICRIDTRQNKKRKV